MPRIMALYSSRPNLDLVHAQKKNKVTPKQIWTLIKDTWPSNFGTSAPDLCNQEGPTRHLLGLKTPKYM